MRKGYTLLELLGLVGIFALIFALSARPIWIMVRQVPHITQMYDLQQQVDSFNVQLRRDVETADALCLEPAGEKADQKALRLHGPGGWVAWRIEPGHVLRTALDDPNEPSQTRAWTLPHVELDWSLYKDDNQPVGVQLRSWINRPLLGKQEMKFRQSRLYFVGLQEPAL